MGCCEALFHFRDTVERAAKIGSIEPVVSMDADMANCFCTLEWDPMRENVAQELPEIEKWMSWSQQRLARLFCLAEARSCATAERSKENLQPQQPRDVLSVLPLAGHMFLATLSSQCSRILGTVQNNNYQVRGLRYVAVASATNGIWMTGKSSPSQKKQKNS